MGVCVVCEWVWVVICICVGVCLVWCCVCVCGYVGVLGSVFVVVFVCVWVLVRVVYDSQKSLVHRMNFPL